MNNKEMRSQIAKAVQNLIEGNQSLAGETTTTLICIAEMYASSLVSKRVMRIRPETGYTSYLDKVNYE